MALTLQESFNNVRLICDTALTNKTERNAVDESLNNIAAALQAHDVMLQAAKDKEPENLEGEFDGCEN